MSKPNITKIAEQAGLSTATVSRVFNNTGKTSEKAREKVISTARKLGYAPKVKLGENNVALLVEGAAGARLGSYSTLLINRIGGGIFSQGLGLEIIPVSNINQLKEKFFKVAISLIYSQAAEKIIRESSIDIPIIFINNQFKGFANICSDHRQGVHSGVEYLYKLGHKKIALFVSNLVSWGSRERFLGYKEALSEFGLEFNEGLIADLNATNKYLEVFSETLRHNPDSIIISGEDNALKVCHTLRAFGKKIPEDLSVISFESDDVSVYLDPPHTTISQNLDGIAKHATDLAMKILNGENIAVRNSDIFLENKIIERHSVINRRGN
jgi:DNA-binding LacI/PurR family transcriptional regulator